jgi:murein DD-endopeptidase MepM/ murein hydrolase activator NlpD
MSKRSYRFNPDSLSFVEEQESPWQRVKVSVSYFGLSLVVAVLYFSVYTAFFETPKEKTLKREAQESILQFELLNRKFNYVSSALNDIQLRDDSIYRAIFEMPPVHNSVRQAGIGGVNRYKELESSPNAEILTATAKRMDMLAKQMYVQSVSFDEVIKLAKNKEAMVACIPAIMPIANKDLTRVASLFGMRMHPFYKRMRMHNGMDFTASSGTEVYSTGDGTIARVDFSASGYGTLIVVDHGFSYSTYYAHLSKVLVNVGQSVKRGEVIGLVGNTGMSMAPHLHYEVRKNDKPINPINYYFNDITSDEYDRMVELAARNTQVLD